jgi:hypothetical protein
VGYLVDFVYICKTGDNEELRYSIRSVVNSFPDARVWIVGGKPDWYVGNHVPVEQGGNKYANAIKNLQALCKHPEISDTFVLMNDDFFIIKKIDKIEQFYNGLLSDKINKYIKITGSSLYIKKLILTNNKLLKLEVKNPIDYELHIPMIMEKEKLFSIVDNYPDCLWRSMYGNLYNIGGTEMPDVKVYANKRHRDRSNEMTENSIFVSTEDNSFKIMLEKTFKKLFVTPSNYEKQ